MRLLRFKKKLKNNINSGKISFISFKNLLKNYLGIIAVCIFIGLALFAYDFAISALFSVLV